MLCLDWLSGFDKTLKIRWLTHRAVKTSIDLLILKMIFGMADTHVRRKVFRSSLGFKNVALRLDFRLLIGLNVDEILKESIWTL